MNDLQHVRRRGTKTGIEGYYWPVNNGIGSTEKI